MTAGGATLPQVRPASSARLVLTLSIAGLLSGLVLVGVYLATKPRIERNRAQALQAAVFEVLPGTESIETFVLEGDALAPYDGPSDVLPDGEAVWAGKDASGGLVGFAIPAEGSGFMDTIGVIYGYRPSEGVIVGMAVLESRETPGLGDKIAYDPEFLENFERLKVDPAIEAVKDGGSGDANEVDCITGATISSEAVVNILNRSTERWTPILRRLDGARDRARNRGGP